MATATFSLLHALNTASHTASQPLASSVLGLPQHQQSTGLDLDWEPFQRHVESFLNAIDVYTVQAKTEISARAADHVAVVRDLGAEKQQIERRIQAERENEGEMLNALHQERTTLSDLSSSIQRLTSQLSKLQTTSQTLDDQAAVIRNAARIERAEKERQKKALEGQKERDGPELMRMEEVLGWKIEGVKQDLLLMRFTLIDPIDPAREFVFTLDVSQREITVPSCNPPLAELVDLVQRLNTEKDMFAFIKAMRMAFKATIPEQESLGTQLFKDLSGPSRAVSPLPAVAALGRSTVSGEVPVIEVSGP